MKVFQAIAILAIFIIFLFDQIHTAPASEKNSTSGIRQSRITVSNVKKVETKNQTTNKISTDKNLANKVKNSGTQSTVVDGRSKQISKAQSSTSATASTKIERKDTQKVANKKTSSTKVIATRPTQASATSQTRTSRSGQTTKVLTSRPTVVSATSQTRTSRAGQTTRVLTSRPTVVSTTVQTRKSRGGQAKSKVSDANNAVDNKEVIQSSNAKVSAGTEKIIQKDSTVTKELNKQKINVESKGTSQAKQISAGRKSDTQRNVVTTTTEATVTDTYESVTSWDGSICSRRFRPHPVDKTKFEAAFTENVFENLYQSCPMSLIWRQELCRCGWPEPEAMESESCHCCNQGLKAHPKNPMMYQRLVNGQWIDEICSNYDNNQIWDNENCTCIWDPKKPQSHKAPVFKGAILPKMMTKCMNLVNMTLDEGLKDANGRDLRPIFGGNRIRVVDETGDIGKSIEIRRAPFKLGIFNGNDLQATVYFKFNFKVHDTRVRQRRKMVILSNGCRRRWQRKSIRPSLEVSFFPHNETFEVQFSTTAKTVVEYMRGQKDQNGWYQCVLYLQDKILNFKVNGQKIYSTNGMSGGVKSTDCPLTVAGSPTSAKNHFDGYLDELQIVKQCKYERDEE